MRLETDTSDLSESLREISMRMASAEAKALDEAVGALIRAGADPLKVEIVYERYSEPDKLYVIHSRMYARVRP